MKLKYLGTAAAEGIPGMFCNCRVCQNALAVRGREIKTRSQAIVDDRLLIDFCPDTYMHVINYGLDLRWVHHCIITHSHMDHFLADDFWCRFEGIASDIGDEPLNVYLTNAGYEKAKEILGGGFNGKRVKFHKIVSFEPFTVEDYRIIPLAANHDAKTDPVIYIIEKGDKTLLYANDTGISPTAPGNISRATSAALTICRSIARVWRSRAGIIRTWDLTQTRYLRTDCAKWDFAPTRRSRT